MVLSKDNKVRTIGISYKNKTDEGEVKFNVVERPVRECVKLLNIKDTHFLDDIEKVRQESIKVINSRKIVNDVQPQVHSVEIPVTDQLGKVDQSSYLALVLGPSDDTSMDEVESKGNHEHSVGVVGTGVGETSDLVVTADLQSFIDTELDNNERKII